MKKIIQIAGHFINTSGKRSPADEREWMFNDKILRYSEAHLKANFEGFTLHRIDDPSGKKDISLQERARLVNAIKGDVLVEIHNNALKGIWGDHSGFETFSPNGSQPNSERLQKILHSKILKAIEGKDRGLKKEDFYIIKNSTNIPSVLVEYFFMDSKKDIVKLRSEAWLKKAGIATAEGIAEFLDLPKKAPKKPAAPKVEQTPVKQKKDVLYRVFEDDKQVGTFSDPRKMIDILIDKKTKKIRIEKI